MTHLPCERYECSQSVFWAIHDVTHRIAFVRSAFSHFSSLLFSFNIYVEISRRSHVCLLVKIQVKNSKKEAPGKESCIKIVISVMLIVCDRQLLEITVKSATKLIRSSLSRRHFSLHLARFSLISFPICKQKSEETREISQ